jgi:hypothetical protein
MHEKYGWDENSIACGYGLACWQLSKTFGDNSIPYKIIALNDSDGKSFSEIADWLEKFYFADWN